MGANVSQKKSSRQGSSRTHTKSVTWVKSLTCLMLILIFHCTSTYCRSVSFSDLKLVLQLNKWRLVTSLRNFYIACSSAALIISNKAAVMRTLNTSLHYILLGCKLQYWACSLTYILFPVSETGLCSSVHLHTHANIHTPSKWTQISLHTDGQ